jgi:hypothetical protein
MPHPSEKDGQSGRSHFKVLQSGKKVVSASVHLIHFGAPFHFALFGTDKRPISLLRSLPTVNYIAY